MTTDRERGHLRASLSLALIVPTDGFDFEPRVIKPQKLTPNRRLRRRDRSLLERNVTIYYIHMNAVANYQVSCT